MLIYYTALTFYIIHNIFITIKDIINFVKECMNVESDTGIIPPWPVVTT